MRVVEDRITFVRVAIIKRNAKQIRAHHKFSREMKPKLAAKEQLIIMNRERIARRKPGNRFIQPVACHCNSIDSWQFIRKLLRLLYGIIAIQVKPGARLSKRVKGRRLRVYSWIVTIYRHR